jgi:folylpolyglutamate synthase/dihydropteroate synthase
VAAAVQQAQSLAGPHDHIVITGSLYTVGEAKEYFEEGGKRSYGPTAPAPPLKNH